MSNLLARREVNQKLQRRNSIKIPLKKIKTVTPSSNVFNKGLLRSSSCPNFDEPQYAPKSFIERQRLQNLGKNSKNFKSRAKMSNPDLQLCAPFELLTKK